MKSRTFLSILGTSNYEEVTYYLEESELNLTTKFIQVALLHFFRDEIKEAYIFVSEKAEERNKEKLLSEIRKHNLKDIPIHFIHLPELEKADDIWKIYEAIYRVLPENSKLVLDITHSFRYMPMVLISLLNYAKFLKNISVEGIYYGNYEKRNDEGRAPVNDLTGLDKIIDWSNAARNVLKFGDAETMRELAKEKYRPILAKTKGSDETAKSMRIISEFYDCTFKNIKSNRLKEIIKSKGLKSAKEALENLNQAYVPSFLPIINKIRPLFENWQEGDVMNGIRAVEICIDKDWIPQGYTFLQESMINLGLDRIGINWQDEKFVNKKIRGEIGTIFRVLNNELEEEVNADWLEAIKERFPSRFFAIFRSISDIRNDINHGGMREASLSSPKLKTKLDQFLKEVKKLVD
ncbi:MAG: TIGR02221 family CRISPR-associated protein [Chlorobi bacterium]|nr:TIGR02221 family CRISPR-associated protein [Chlorobiota bacterium]